MSAKAEGKIKMKKDITVPTGKVIGIGKLKVFTTEYFPYIIPTLSFIVAKDDTGSYTASCIHLLLDSSADNDREAVERLQQNCKSFLSDLFEQMDKDAAWNELHELVNSRCSEPFWKAYRDIQLNLSEKGIELKFEKEKFYEKRVKELESQIAVLKSIKASMDVRVVSYQPYGAAA